MSRRRATHAGSWYSSDGYTLSSELDRWLGSAGLSHGPARAIIAPHAGYTYCGATAAWAYRQVSPAVVKNIFILGPSHHVRLHGCALSVAQKYETPLYDLNINSHINKALHDTQRFTWMNMKTDEDEHSIEMHLPYIAKVMQMFEGQFEIIPILVGSLSPTDEEEYGKIFARYMANPQNLFVISSDFCHWGSRFRYTYYDQSGDPIYKSIENLDKAGMDIIETLSPSDFTEYLKKYNNTICGRHPISLMLSAANILQKGKYGITGYENTLSFKFLKYAQSSRCEGMNDSSVSYASGSLVF